MESDAVPVALRNITQRFGSRDVLRNINVSFAYGEVAVVLGKSGVGKTTLLNVLAGLDRPLAGERVIGRGQRLSYMLQDEGLFPWRNAFENAVFGCEVSHSSEQYALELLGRLEMQASATMFPEALSGGMKQRVSFIRAIAPRPNILLLDEPFAAIDFDMKIEMQRVILEFVAATSGTVIVVTHDLDDAAALGKHIFRLAATRLEIIDAQDNWDERLRTLDDFAKRRRSDEHIERVRRIASKLGSAQ
jgi:ABC-type nitrate/sulfonate/bicarbonate transport system ATPase subunit